MRFHQYNKKSRVAFALYFGILSLMFVSAFILNIFIQNDILKAIIMAPFMMAFILALLKVIIATLTISDEGIEYRGLFLHHKIAWQEIGQVGISLAGGRDLKKSFFYFQTRSEKLDYEVGSRGGWTVNREHINAEQRKKSIAIQYNPSISIEIKKYWKGKINNLDLIEG